MKPAVRALLLTLAIGLVVAVLAFLAPELGVIDMPIDAFIWVVAMLVLFASPWGLVLFGLVFGVLWVAFSAMDRGLWPWES